MKKKLEIIGFIIVWLTIAIQFVLIIQNRVTGIPETVIRFFSFFTILTNGLVALYFTAKLFNVRNKLFRMLRKEAAITAVTTFILVVGIVYQVVLRSIWEPTGIQRMVDELLHTIIPIYFFIYWVVSLKNIKAEFNSQIHIRPILYWLAYPGLYIVFILIRGYFSGYYPYPFLDVGEIGYQNVLQSIVIILAGMILQMIVLVVLGRFIQKMKVTANTV